MKNIIYIFLFGWLGMALPGILLAQAKSSQKDKFEIKGTMKNLAPGTQLYLEHITSQKMSFIDTSVVNEKGQFSFQGAVPLKSLARIKIQNSQNNFMIALENSSMEFDGDANDLNNYTIKGSKESEYIKQFALIMRSGTGTIPWVKNYIDTVKSPLLAYLAVNHLKIADEYNEYVKVADRLVKEGSELVYSTDFRKFVLENSKLRKLSSGSDAPIIGGKSPTGVEYDLTMMKGKVYLLDFWASWCGPCRKENPAVVAAYNKYKDKGFTVFGVSLDSNPQAWQTAIEKDKLVWETHISDLKGWQSEYSKIYQVNSIPQSFLIGPDGKIIAKNLRGDALDKALDEFYNKK